MIIIQLQSMLFRLTIGDEGSAIVLGITKDGAMIEMRKHPLPFTAMVIIVANGMEDKAVVGVVDVVLVMRLRLEQGIAGLLTVAFDTHSAHVEKAIEYHKLVESRVGMLLNYCLDIVERGVDFAIAPAA
ncbi:MAG: hypothetical protein J5543_04530 [Bacteroidales bacterium]|nr:hypothetical protein [Bacteroidales bacterium]